MNAAEIQKANDIRTSLVKNLEVLITYKDFAEIIRKEQELTKSYKELMNKQNVIKNMNDNEEDMTFIEYSGNNNNDKNKYFERDLQVKKTELEQIKVAKQEIDKELAKYDVDKVLRNTRETFENFIQEIDARLNSSEIPDNIKTDLSSIKDNLTILYKLQNYESLYKMISGQINDELKAFLAVYSYSKELNATKVENFHKFKEHLHSIVEEKYKDSLVHYDEIFGLKDSKNNDIEKTIKELDKYRNNKLYEKLKNNALKTKNGFMSVFEQLAKPIVIIPDLIAGGQYSRALYFIAIGLLSAVAGVSLLATIFPGLLIASIVGGVVGIYLGFGAVQSVSEMISPKPLNMSQEGYQIIIPDILRGPKVTDIVDIQILDNVCDGIADKLVKFLESRFSELEKQSKEMYQKDSTINPVILANSIRELQGTIDNLKIIIADINKYRINNKNKVKDADKTRVVSSLNNILKNEYSAVKREYKNAVLNTSHKNDFMIRHKELNNLVELKAILNDTNTLKPNKARI